MGIHRCQDGDPHLTTPCHPAITAQFGDDLPGLFTGEAIHERGESPDPSLPQIHFYLENIREQTNHDPASYRKEIRITFPHELGHCPSWNGEDMERHGLE
jgi:predicted Zn-dependent protease with MMP-like domain